MYDFDRPLRIGTRGSRLALTQTHLVVDRLKAAFPQLQVEIKTIDTSGDWKKEHGETRLPDNKGGKGLFLKEVEEALISDYIDCGVHSMKDVPSVLDEGLCVDHVLEREDPRDAFICSSHGCYYSLPEGAVVGTASLRRQAAIKRIRPDLEVTILRGNVDTRLQKVKDGQVDAAVLAAAGLKRLGLEGRVTKYFKPEEMLPACGQGVVTIETIQSHTGVRFLLDSIHHEETGLTVTAERAALQALEGSCQTPVGAYATLDENNQMHLRVCVYEEDGSAIYADEAKAAIKTTKEAFDLGFKIGQKIRPLAPEKLFA